MDWNKPIFYRGETLNVEVNRARGFNEKQLNRLLSVIQKMLIVINSLEFKINVTSVFDMQDTNGKTQIEVYDLFMSGRDIYENPSTDDHTMNIDITLVYKRFSRVVGWTYPGTMRSWFNRKFWRDDCFVAGNLVHEYLHNLGFYDPSGSRSVTYIYGNAVTRLMRELNEGKVFTPVKRDMVRITEEKSVIDQ